MKVFSIVRRYDPSITSVTIECRDNTSLSAVVATIVLNLICLYQECFHLIVFYIHAKVVGRAITDINKQCNLLSTVMSGSYRPRLLQFLWICITLDAQFIFNCFVHRMKSNRFFFYIKLTRDEIWTDLKKKVPTARGHLRAIYMFHKV